MGGFIGATEDGVTTTLGRGGSDFTASIVGAGIGAEEIQIWTDVDGMLTADPHLRRAATAFKIISFTEAAELAYFGAKVLHPSTVLPAVEKNIPVLILNSRRPEVEGTRIVAEAVHCDATLKSIACKTEHHRRQHHFHAHADGVRFPAAHLRGLRPLRDAGGHGGDLGSERLPHHRQHDRAWRRSATSCASSPKFSRADHAIVCLVGDNIRGTPASALASFARSKRVNVVWYRWAPRS